MLAGLAAAALLLTPAVAAAAGGEKGDWELGIYAGQGFLDDYQRPGDTALAPADDLLYGARVGYFLTSHWSLEAAYQMLATETDLGGTPADVDMDLDAVRLNMLYNFMPGARVRPFLTLGAGLESSDAGALLEEGDLGLNAGVGVRFLLTDRFGLRFDARYVSIDVSGAVDDTQGNVEATLGVSWAFGGAPPADGDGDGVPDRKDDCPDTPRGATVDAHGCPSDSDGDGVFDGLDRCPGTAQGLAVDAGGCPQDSDGDGVNDALDKCPDTPRGATVDAEGCPSDSDGDGVLDGLDRCPDTPRGATVEANGCPSDSDGDGVFDGLDRCPGTGAGVPVDAVGCPRDSDGDGVPDHLDKCPDTAAGTKVGDTGCPLLFVEERRSLVLEGVEFEFNRSTLTADSRKILDRVALSLEQWQDIKVEVAGHTDSRGKESYNMTLSRRRAEAVRDYLIARGVKAEQIVARGYGPSRPIADNGSEEGRQKNRRVELKRLD